MPLRVALLTSANGWRGSGASYAKIARGLSERGHVAHVVTAVPRLTSRLAGLGLPVTEIPGRNTGPREIAALLGVLRRHRLQSLVVDTPRDVRLSAYATLLHRARVLYRYNLNYRRPRTDLMDRIYLSRVSACIYQSRWIQEDAAGHAEWMRRIPSYRVPNGYDTARYAPRPEEGLRFRATYGIAPDVAVVVSLAKLTKHKGHEVAMAALARLERDGVRLLYLVCGDGGREEELRRLAGSLKLPTLFTGLLESDQLIAALAAADVMVHPSLHEIFPNAVGEAMACGKAVVAADAGGTSELLGKDGEAGILVPPGDPDALAQAIGGLLADREGRERLGAAARRRIESEFPLSRMIDGYERVLGEVSGPASGVRAALHSLPE
jgi:glycosyltransferase involved in cell wall biosynthesis